MPIPAIAIHGSGPHDKIARAIDANFDKSGLYERVETAVFDWDHAVPHYGHTGVRSWLRFLKQNAANVRAASSLGFQFRAHYLDGLLGSWQALVHALLQWAVPALVAMAALQYVAEIVVLAPAGWYGLPTEAFPPVRWLVDAVGWTTVGVAAGLATLFVLGALRLFLTLSPRPVIITFRSIGLLLLQPLWIVVVGAFAADTALLASGFAALGALAFVDGGVGALVACALSAGAVFGLRRLWAGSPGGPIKAMIDGFRYLGEPEYRTGIQQALDQAIQRARGHTGEDRQFILVGQGLGTVIALDSVMHSRVWSATDQVLLVTMASPLRRYLLPLFPRTLFPETLEDLVDVIAGRLGQFRWMNVYRPGDYVGGELGLSAFNGRDVSTRQPRRGLGGHADYWLDLDVRHAFHRGLRQLTEVRPLQVPMMDAAHRVPHPPKPRASWHIPPAMRPVLGTTLSLALVGGMVWWVATGLGVLAPRGDDPFDTLGAGVTVDAAATHRRETVRRANGLTFVHHWEFAFTDPNGAAQNLYVTRDASDAFLAIPSRFDDRALARHVRAACADGPGRPPWWPMADEETCTQDGVRLRYYPSDMMVFDLPEFPRQAFGSDPVRDWTEVGLVAGALSALTLLPLLFGLQVFTVLLGAGSLADNAGRSGGGRAVSGPRPAAAAPRHQRGMRPSAGAAGSSARPRSHMPKPVPARASTPPRRST